MSSTATSNRPVQVKLVLLGKSHSNPRLAQYSTSHPLLVTSAFPHPPRSFLYSPLQRTATFRITVIATPSRRFTPHSIAPLHPRRLSRLLVPSDDSNQLNPSNIERELTKFNCAGESAVGKSSVVLRFCQNDFQENKEPTIGQSERTFCNENSGCSFSISTFVGAAFLT